MTSAGNKSGLSVMGVNDYFGNGGDSVKRQSEKERNRGKREGERNKGKRDKERDSAKGKSANR